MLVATGDVQLDLPHLGALPRNIPEILPCRIVTIFTFVCD
jgi:hypothetical protein